MPHLMLSWQYALAAAGVLAIVATVIRVGRLAGRPAGGAWALWGGVARESALLLGLYALWQFAGSFTVMSTAGAVPRARWLWHAERVLMLPSETSLQRPFLAHPALVQAFNLYYDILHFPALGACLDLALRPAPGVLSAGQDHRGPVHRGQPARPADPSGAAAAAAGYWPGRHGCALRPVGVLLARRLRRRRVLGHALGARRLGADRGYRGHHGVAEPMAVAGRGLPCCSRCSSSW